jgi:hypothetical protein
VHGSALASFVYILPLNSSLYGTAPLASCATIVCFDFGGKYEKSSKKKVQKKDRKIIVKNNKLLEGGGEKKF